MLDMTVADKRDVLMQTMNCVGTWPMHLECIAHDCGLSVIETACLLLSLVRQHPEIRHCERGFYIDEN